ncbi:hypothetical protein AZE42_11389 [Rhizopogon vesiculosus]|uniref:Uncharacterized protein n=1 Tax=Rhizopogon vesiculosus TaxID=180088 RepID=A0A1J8Q4B9_9AGAM|nr:hypothetical protein AZE42_11389 [Rhizopogon vesiculosus]
MVHRPPDSRLLSNLIAHEKEYAKHLSALFPISHAALASLSAFAAASPSATPFSKSSVSLAQTIGAIVDILAGADDALQRYNQALENWRGQLGRLIDLEEDIGAILRDREILVTRLIKVSKSSKAARDSRPPPVGPSGSASFTSLPSINSTAHGSCSTKLLQAQEELRACEAHLAAKELELDAHRISIAREGLGARCRALIDCGWVWSEMGKEGLRALQSLGTSNSDNQGVLICRYYCFDHSTLGKFHSCCNHSVPEPPLTSPSHSQTPSITLPQQKPLHSPALLPQGPLSYSSDISSLTPSQSASQQHDALSGETSQEGIPDHPVPNGREEVTIAIPAAHAISELTMPTGVRSPSPLSPPLPQSSIDLHLTDTEAPRSRSTQQKRRPLSRRITEENEDEDEYKEEQAASVLRSDFPSLERAHDDSSEEDGPQGPLEVVENNPFGRPKRFTLRQEVAPEAENEQNGKQRERKASLSFFSSLRGLFKASHKDQTRAESTDPTASPLVSKGRKGKKGWSTRTDANLKASRSQGSSDSEPDTVLKAPLPSGGAKLRKGRSQTRASALSSGWQTDGPPSASSRITVRQKKKSIAELKGKDGGYTDGEFDANDSVPSSLPPRSQSEILARRPSAKRQAPLISPQPTPASLSPASSMSTRNSVITSPSLSSSAGKARHRRATTDLSGHIDSGNGEVLNTDSPRRSASLTYGAAPQHVRDLSAVTKPKSKRAVKAGTIHPLPAKGSTSVSLMSIVEDVSRQNRNSRGATVTSVPPVPSRSSLDLPSSTKLEVPRAPIPGVPINAIWSSKLSDDRLPARRSTSLDIPYAPGSVFFQSVSGAQGTAARKHEITPNAASTGQSNSSVSASISEPRRASRPAVSPLRSALRNSSRTPSPSPVQLAEIRKRRADVRTEDGDKPRGRTPEREEPGQCTPRPAQPGQATQLNDVSIRDSVSMTSISSYETGRESPCEEEPAPEVPPASQYDAESSTASTETPLARRKSVRVSLQPTFSPTPPALEDDDTHGRYPWNSSERKGDQNGSGEPDLWQDSSDEDEEYSRARKLLSRVGKKGKGKKKV